MAGNIKSPKQLRFIDEYLVDLNGKQACIRAGYSEKTAEVKACQLLQDPSIAQEIEKRQQELSEKTKITQEMVLQELAKIGFANMLDYMSVDKNGDMQVDMSDLTREQASAISEYHTETLHHEDGSEVQKVRFKLLDKRQALVDIGKHLGMFTNKVEVEQDSKVNITVSYE